MSRAGRSKPRPPRLKPALTLTPVGKHTTRATGTRAADVLERAGVPRQYLYEQGGWCFPTTRTDDVIAAAVSLGGTAQDSTGSLW